uniref:Uncharacterized protein n=1 Tax=Angiostrongylus cantonensis TaxID=6313 RepID=A0A0K0CT45_ANGCA
MTMGVLVTVNVDEVGPPTLDVIELVAVVVTMVLTAPVEDVVETVLVIATGGVDGGVCDVAIGLLRAFVESAGE